MATFNENVFVNGAIEVASPWGDWIFLRQKRDANAGGFHIHNPWADSTHQYGTPDRNRLDISYMDGAGRHHWGQFVLHGPTGNVGIGDSNPQQKLAVSGGGARINGVTVGTDAPGINYQFEHETVGVAAANFNLRLQSPNAIVFHTGGNVPPEKVIITSDGDIRLVGADCAEFFETTDPSAVEPGTVLVIADGGSVRACDAEYDKRVAGVVSGGGGLRPGIILDQGSERAGVPVALTGKVYCKVDARPESVDVGDLLTTSSTEGHAMKASDATRHLGAVLGKALAPLGGGRDMIPVLVALQ